MKVDTSKSQYREDPEGRGEYTAREWKHLRYLLRRLQFLEAQLESRDSISSVHVQLEADALEWLLTDVGFLKVSGNTE